MADNVVLEYLLAQEEYQNAIRRVRKKIFYALLGLFAGLASIVGLFVWNHDNSWRMVACVLWIVVGVLYCVMYANEVESACDERDQWKARMDKIRDDHKHASKLIDDLDAALPAAD